MLSNNLLDNFPVFVEFNPTYKLLFVSCLLDQKIFFSRRTTYTWLDKTNWEERIQIGVLELKEKENEGTKTQKLLFVSSWSILIAI